MDPFQNVSEVQKKIRMLEGRERSAMLKLERAKLQKKEGARFYQGTALPIDDVIFSLREGQVRSARLTLDFYRKTLSQLVPAASGLPVGMEERPPA